MIQVVFRESIMEIGIGEYLLIFFPEKKVSLTRTCSWASASFQVI
jgi:hypothetical protein